MHILPDTLNLGPGFLDDAIFIDIRVSEERFVCDRVPAFINSKINVARLFETCEDFTDDILVTVFAGPDEVVIAAVQELPRLNKALGDLVYKGLRGLTSSNRRIGYLLRMLIRAGQKPRVTPLHPVIPSLSIRQKSCRCSPNVRHGVDIINGSGDIRSHGEFLKLCGEAARFFKGVMAATRATGAEPLSHRPGQLFDNRVYHLPDWCYSLDPQNPSLQTWIAGAMFPRNHKLDTALGHLFLKMDASSRTDSGRTCT